MEPKIGAVAVAGRASHCVAMSQQTTSWAHSPAPRPKVGLGDNYVVATILLDRMKLDGMKIDTACSSCSIVKVVAGWRFLAWVPTEPLLNGRCTQ
jgi:hypothetical protein